MMYMYNMYIYVFVLCYYTQEATGSAKITMDHGGVDKDTSEAADENSDITATSNNESLQDRRQ